MRPGRSRPGRGGLRHRGPSPATPMAPASRADTGLARVIRRDIAAAAAHCAAARMVRQFRRLPRPGTVRADQPVLVAPLTASLGPVSTALPGGVIDVHGEQNGSVYEEITLGSIMSPRSARARKIAQVCWSAASTVSTVITVPTSTPGISPGTPGRVRGFSPRPRPLRLPRRSNRGAAPLRIGKGRGITARHRPAGRAASVPGRRSNWPNSTAGQASLPPRRLLEAGSGDYRRLDAASV